MKYTILSLVWFGCVTWQNTKKFCQICLSVCLLVLPFVCLDKISFSKHDDVIKWIPFPRYWPFARGIHRSPVNSPHKGQRRGALIFSVISAQINDWVNNREAGGLRRIRLHYDVTVMDNFVHFILPRLWLRFTGPSNWYLRDLGNILMSNIGHKPGSCIELCYQSRR